MPTTTETAIDTSTQLFEKAVALDAAQARTVAYWCLATHAIETLPIFPILSIQGPLGTGKSTLMNLMAKLVFEPRTGLDGTESSRPVVRDLFQFEKTVFVEEADGISESQVIKRYSRLQSTVPTNRRVGDGWAIENLNLFGPTVFHRRRAWSDAATHSRSITIKTRASTNIETIDVSELPELKSLLKGMAETLPWGESTLGTDRTSDTWSPLVFAAQHLGDETWLRYATEEIERIRQVVSLGQQEEPWQKLFAVILETVLGQNAVGGRVKLADVTEKCQRLDMDMNSWQIGSTVRDWGFETPSRGGTKWIDIPDESELVSVGLVLGVEDEWLTERA